MAHLRLGADPEPPVKNNAQGVPSPTDAARQLGVIGQDRFRADQDRVHVVAQLVNFAT